jgi:hypothetical protein
MATENSIRGIKDNSRRRYPGKGGRTHNPVNFEDKCKEAAERQAAWDALTPAAKLKVLDARLGEGVGAAKQRAALTALIRVETPAKVAVQPAEETSTVLKVKAKDRKRVARDESLDK